MVLKQGEYTTISVPKSLIEILERIKVHRNEPLYEVIQRIAEEHNKAEA